MNKSNIFYERLIKEADQCVKSLNQIERELGYPRNALNNYKNKGIPSGKRVIELARYFSVSPEYLTGQEDCKTPVCIQNLFKELSEEEKLELFLISHEWGYKKINLQKD